MSQSIGSLVIKLEAQTAALRTDMAEARRIIDSNTGAMKGAFAGVQSAARVAAGSFAAIGVSLGIGALVSYSRQVIETVGGLGEMADQLGVTTDGLQALQYQALQSGASVETLDGGLARLTRSIGDAAEGNDALLNRFKSLGVGILDSGGKIRSTEAVLEDVAKSIAAIDDPAKRAAAVVDLFGKSGQKLMPLLMDLANVGLPGLKSQAREAGAVVDEALIKRFDEIGDKAAVAGKRLTVFTADAIGYLIVQAGKGAKALDDLFRVRDNSGTNAAIARGAVPGLSDGGMFGGDTTQGGGPVVPGGPTRTPYIDEFGAGFVPPRLSMPGGPTSNPASTRDLQNQAAGDAFIRSLELQRDVIGQTESAALRLRLEREMEIKVVDGVLKPTQKYTSAQIDAAVAVQGQIEAITALNRAQMEAGKTAAALSAEREKERNAGAEARNRAALAGDKSNRAVEDLRAQAPLIAGATIEWNKYTQQFEAVNTELDIFLRKNAIIAEGIVGPSEAERQARQEVTADTERRKAMEAQTFQVRGLQNAYDELSQFGERSFDRIGASITEAFAKGEDAMVSFKSIGRAILSEIAQEFMKLAILNPLKNAIFGGNAATLSSVGGLLGSMFSGGGIGNYFGGASYSSLGSAGLAFGGPRAEGGPVAAGKTYLVGEEGPELVAFGAAGRVYPAGESAAMMRGGRGGDTYYLDARGADQAAVARLEQAVNQLNGTLEKRALGAFADDYARGGSISKMMARA